MYFLDIDITDDVVNLFKVINYLEQQMSDVFACTFEKEMSLLKSPDVIMSFLLTQIENEGDNEVSILYFAKLFILLINSYFTRTEQLSLCTVPLQD